MCRNWKWFLAIFLVIFGLGVRMDVLAEEEYTYSIDSVDCAVAFTENGDAVVTEDWTVTYDGVFTRLYKDIHIADLPELEVFQGITVLDASINGDQIFESQNYGQREHNTYEITYNSENITVQWNYHANYETVHYSITYVLNNVVTVTDNGRALFCYRFIGKNFEHRIERFSLMINPVGNGQTELRFCNLDPQEITPEGSSKVCYSLQQFKGLVKFNIGLDGSFFNDQAKYVPLERLLESEKADDKQKKKDEMIENLLFGGFVFAFFGGIFAVIFAIGHAIYYSILAGNPDYVKKCLEVLRQKKISPVVVLMNNRPTKKLCFEKFFLAQLLYLIYVGVISYDPKKDTFSVSNSVFANIAQQDLDFLKVFEVCAHEGFMKGSSIMGKFREYVVYSEGYFSRYPYAIKGDRKLKKACDIVYRAAKKEKVLPPFSLEVLDYMYIVKQGIMQLNTATNFEREYNTCIDYMDYCACESLYDIQRAEQASSSTSGSGCSGCSSCSSCSGCGGGGAD